MRQPSRSPDRVFPGALRQHVEACVAGAVAAVGHPDAQQVQAPVIIAGALLPLQDDLACEFCNHRAAAVPHVSCGTGVSSLQPLRTPCCSAHGHCVVKHAGESLVKLRHHHATAVLHILQCMDNAPLGALLRPAAADPALAAAWHCNVVQIMPWRLSAPAAVSAA